MKESEVTFPQPGQDKSTGRGTLPNPIGTGVEQLPDPIGSVFAVFTTELEINDYSTTISNLGPDFGSKEFAVNDYTNERSFIILRGMTSTAPTGLAAVTASIVARFAAAGQPDPLTSVLIRYQVIPDGGSPRFDRTVFFSIVTFDP
jgi:hypothetical protein